MGKNQAYKAMQRSRLSGSADAEEVEDGMVDGTFHSPEWHAARLASLNKSHTVTWEEFKRKQKIVEKAIGHLIQFDMQFAVLQASLPSVGRYMITLFHQHLDSIY